MSGTLLAAGIVLSKATVLTLADLHVGRFAHMVEIANSGGVRLGEAQAYLELWKAIRVATAADRDLTSEQREELFDACTCGEYDVHLAAEEYSAVHRPESRAS
jgi:hypothetical protein